MAQTGKPTYNILCGPGGHVKRHAIVHSNDATVRVDGEPLVGIVKSNLKRIADHILWVLKNIFLNLNIHHYNNYLLIIIIKCSFMMIFILIKKFKM